MPMIGTETPEEFSFYCGYSAMDSVTREITRAKTRRLAKLYEDCFAEEPWCEVFAPGEAVTWLREMIRYQDNISLGWEVYFKRRIVGALFAFPVSFKNDVAAFLPESLKPEDVIYIAEAFVKKSFRNKGIATKLHDECLVIAKRRGFSHAIARTNLASKMYPIFEAKGYSVIGMQEVVSNKRVGDRIVPVPDERGIFLRSL